MDYFTINTLADYGRGDYCFTDDTPDGIGTRWYRLAKGVAFGDEYPSDPDEVRLNLGEDYPGIKLPSFIGNTTTTLIVDAHTAQTILSHNVGQIERLPFVLINHKGKVHSRDYVFLSPLERINSLNLELSEVRRSTKGEIKEVKRIVLDRTKEKDFLDLFRLGEDPTIYILSERLVAALRAAGATNFAFKAVEAR